MTMEKIAFVKTILNWFSTPSMGREIDADFLEDAYDEVTKPQWISVEDEMPDTDDCGNSDFHLVYGSHDSYHVAYYCGKNEWYTEDGEPLIVTHWMPLPQPPKKGGEV